MTEEEKKKKELDKISNMIYGCDYDSENMNELRKYLVRETYDRKNIYS